MGTAQRSRWLLAQLIDYHRRVVFFSMATSSGEEVPRNVEFLYSRNRLNVAVSRAKCLAVLVCSPSLLTIRCRTVEQMRLVNALCLLVELAEEQSARITAAVDVLRSARADRALASGLGMPEVLEFRSVWYLERYHAVERRSLALRLYGPGPSRASADARRSEGRAVRTRLGSRSRRNHRRARRLGRSRHAQTTQRRT